MRKNYLVSGIIFVFVLVLAAGAIFYFERGEAPSSSPFFSFPQSPSPEPTTSPFLSFSPLPSISFSLSPKKTPKPMTSTYPGFLLTGEATCELRGEIKFIDNRTYDNQDALFSYTGVDHPGRLIFWTISPNDNLSIGPNLFSSLQLPHGQSLISVVLPESPKSKKYELTVSINYGRLVDGNVKIFDKPCVGKTTVVLP